MRNVLCGLLVSVGFLLTGCGDADTVSEELDSEFIPYEGSSSRQKGEHGGLGSAVVDPCFDPRCERPNWEGHEGIIDPLTDHGVAPLATEIPAFGISAPR